MQLDDVGPYRLLVDVQFEVDSDDKLANDGEDEDVGELAVDPCTERTSFMRVTQEVAARRQCVTSCLWDD